MNLKFWQNTPAEPVKIETPPAVPPEPVMSETEQAIYDHFLKNERLWTIRRWKVGDKPSIRADFQDVPIISRKELHIPLQGYETIPATFYIWRASVGSYAFSPVFAKEWHEMLVDRINGRELVENERAVTAIQSQLEQRFGVTRK